MHWKAGVSTTSQMTSGFKGYKWLGVMAKNSGVVRVMAKNSGVVRVMAKVRGIVLAHGKSSWHSEGMENLHRKVYGCGKSKGKEI